MTASVPDGAAARYSRRVFLLAVAWGALTLLPLPFLRGQVEHGVPLTHPEYFYGFVGTCIAFQFVFLQIAREPRTYRPFIPFCVMEKAAFAVPVFWLVLRGQAERSLLLFGVVDAVFFFLFLLAYFRLGARGEARDPW